MRRRSTSTPNQAGPKSNPAQLKKLYQLVAPYWQRIALGLCGMLISTTGMLIMPQYARAVFNQAIEGKDVSQLTNLALQLAGVVAILSIGIIIRSYYIRTAGWLAVNDLRRQLLQNILKQDIKFFGENPAGELLSRMLSDITLVREFVQFGVAAFIRAALLGIGATIMLFHSNAFLAGVLFTIAPVLIAVTAVLGPFWRRQHKAMQDTMAAVSRNIEEMLYGMRTVKAFGQEEREFAQTEQKLQNHYSLARLFILATGGFFAFNMWFGFSAIIVVLWLGGQQIIDGTMPLGDLIAFVMYLSFLGDAFSNLSEIWPQMQSTAGATERVFGIISQKPTLKDPKKPQILPKPHQNGRTIQLKKVCFAYGDDSQSPTLKNLNLTIKAGETIAFVGPSGAGKSTLFNLLLRFYDVTQGEILIDGLNVKDLKQAHLRQTMGIVPQEATLFSTTIRENIAYGNPTATEEDIIQAAKAAQAWEFIEKLPKKLDAIVGEKGVKLSGGQRQRIAIARALLLNPSVLLLDEATSHLDAASEQAVQQALETARKGRTTLIIAHRLATVKAADRIIVLEEGNLLATGTHNQLLKTCDLYAHLASLQLLA